MESYKKVVGRQAEAYMLGSVIMMGTREINGNNFLSGVDGNGQPISAGENLGAVVSNGEAPNSIVLGVATSDGRHMWTLPTRRLAEVTEVPAGLQRV